MPNKQALVGIWWFYGGRPIFVHSVPLSQGLHYGSAITGIKDHADYWEELQESGKLTALPVELRDEYFSIPRGRVIYHEDSKIFSVYHGNNISKKNLQKVRAAFNLPKDDTVFEKDLHYCDFSDDEWKSLAATNFYS